MPRNLLVLLGLLTALNGPLERGAGGYCRLVCVFLVCFLLPRLGLRLPVSGLVPCAGCLVPVVCAGGCVDEAACWWAVCQCQPGLPAGPVFWFCVGGLVLRKRVAWTCKTWPMSDPVSPEPRPSRGCSECGADISHRHSSALVCGDDCARERLNRRGRERRRLLREGGPIPPGLCQVCGAKLRGARARFCGEQCRWKHHYSIPENRQRRLEYSRRHKAANREHNRARNRAYYARPEVIAREKARAELRQSRRCEHCGKGIGHMHPNFRFCCAECRSQAYRARPEVRESLRAAGRRHYARKRAQAAAEPPDPQRD